MSFVKSKEFLSFNSFNLYFYPPRKEANFISYGKTCSIQLKSVVSQMQIGQLISLENSMLNVIRLAYFPYTDVMILYEPSEVSLIVPKCHQAIPLWTGIFRCYHHYSQAVEICLYVLSNRRSVKHDGACQQGNERNPLHQYVSYSLRLVRFR